MTNIRSQNRQNEMTENAVVQSSQEILLNEKVLAARWGISVKTLQNKRVQGDGIPFLKLGRSVRYQLKDVVEFERASLRLSTSEGGAL